jgi:hypothetical protein
MSLRPADINAQSGVDWISCPSTSITCSSKYTNIADGVWHMTNGYLSKDLSPREYGLGLDTIASDLT